MLTSELEPIQNEYNESYSLRTTSSGTTEILNPRMREKALLYGTTIGIPLSILAFILVILLCLVVTWYRRQQSKSKLLYYFLRVVVSYCHTILFIVEHAIKPQKVAVNWRQTQQRKLYQIHIIKRSLFCILITIQSVKVRSLNNFLLLVQIVIRNSIKTRKIMLYLLLTLYPWTKT